MSLSINAISPAKAQEALHSPSPIRPAATIKNGAAPCFVANLNQATLAHLLDLDELRRIARIAAVWLARAIAIARLVRAIARAFQAILCTAHRIVKRAAPVVIAGLLAAPVQPLLLTARSVTSIDTAPLVQAAQQKQATQENNKMLVHAPRENGGIVKSRTRLAPIAGPVAYAETMRLYHARCDNPNDEAARRAWENHSAAAIGGTVLQARPQKAAAQ